MLGVWLEPARVQAHIVHGNHSADFYRLMDELHDEFDATRHGAGSDGAGTFSGRGHNLDSARHNPVNRDEARRLAVAAAETRVRRQQLMGGLAGGQRLGGRGEGGGGPVKKLSPQEAAAQAAERRLRDSVWCPSSIEFAAVEESDEDEVDVQKNEASIATAASSLSSSSSSRSSNTTVELLGQDHTQEQEDEDVSLRRNKQSRKRKREEQETEVVVDLTAECDCQATTQCLCCSGSRSSRNSSQTAAVEVDEGWSCVVSPSHFVLDVYMDSERQG